MDLLTKVSDINCRPIRAHASDAGMDLKSTISTVLEIDTSIVIDSGVAFKIPIGYVGLVFARSGMAKYNVSPANCVGVIDSEYRGNVKINLHNYSSTPYKIEKYDRIGQIVILPIALPNLIIADWDDNIWFDTDRGLGGFGSTGIK